MPDRTIAIGDIHGCADALAALLDAVALAPTDTIVTLGDHIDRGPDSRRVVDQLIALANRCQLIPLMGDHEEMLLDALRDTANLKKWLACGGVDTLRSYGWSPGGRRSALADWIPEPHRAFLNGCRPYHETATHLFMHAGFVPELPVEQQPGLALRWRVTDAQTAVPHCSGKVAVVGHTPQLSGEVLNLGFLHCIDTNCARGGYLTALDTSTGRIWQADGAGKLRSSPTAADSVKSKRG
jgi:serine/threonine protein phosphatase 1